jgi:hypothetical protein
MDDVVDADDSIVQRLLGFLGGSVGTDVCRPVTLARSHRGNFRGPRLCRLTDLDVALRNHGAVGLVDDAVDLLEIIRVRDHLIAGEDVLIDAGLAAAGRGRMQGAGASQTLKMSILAVKGMCFEGELWYAVRGWPGGVAKML